jgi:uncharacterized SAM-dependent methyltransferase
MNLPFLKKHEFNDLIFKEIIKRGYAVEDRKRIWSVADSKLWYLTPEQSQAFLDLESSKEYVNSVTQKELDLINKHLMEILDKLGKDTSNIIDLGCGDGKKAVIFIEKLRDRMKLRYCPIDISSYMVQKAIKRIKSMKVGEVIEFQWNISDFENISNISSLLREGEFKKNLVLLLGNTLGNFEINELLYSIRSSMKKGDILVIGNGLDNRHTDDIVRSYYTKEVNNFLVHLPLSLGLEKKDLLFGVRFRNSRIEVLYTLQRDRTIVFQNKRIELKQGDEIVAAVSYKYNKENFKTFLNLHFDDVDVYTSDDNSYALAVCKK